MAGPYDDVDLEEHYEDNREYREIDTDYGPMSVPISDSEEDRYDPDDDPDVLDEDYWKDQYEDVEPDPIETDHNDPGY